MAKDLLVVWHNMSSGDTNVQHIIILDWNKEHLILIHALSKELSVLSDWEYNGYSYPIQISYMKLIVALHNFVQNIAIILYK